MFPVHAKCVTFDAGWEKERKRVHEMFTLGQVYTIRTMHVNQSSTDLTFYEVPGVWNSVFFDAVLDYEDYDAG